MSISVDPSALFSKVTEWLNAARAADASWWDAMSLATVGPGGKPSARMVLLKEFTEQGFVFYTNFQSRKGRELLAFPHAAICFHWSSLGRQLRAEGSITQVNSEQADAYFATRPRVSQIGAWASHQSELLESREELEERVRVLERQYEGRPIPRPPHWSGFRLAPEMIELWQAEVGRLHRRDVYDRTASGWTHRMLNP